ncbi:MAG: ZIP family metal transporter [Aquificaceae bacterium]|nr:ZIP family metal transporter [Aquificaceae bacterium]
MTILSLLLIGTAIGSLLGAFIKRELIEVSTVMGLAGGFMIVASFTALMLPAIEVSGFILGSIGIISGFIFMVIADRYISDRETNQKKSLNMMLFGILVHNAPEGLSVGVSGAFEDFLGLKVALAIALHDVPEGFLVSLAVILSHGKPSIAFFVGFLSGVLEALFAVGGFMFIDFFQGGLGFWLGFGGGVMVYVTAKEVFPEAFRGEKTLKPSAAFLFGLLMMLFLDTRLKVGV